jgi:para-aminobenzoate N-oxygenase AurF
MMPWSDTMPWIARSGGAVPARCAPPLDEPTPAFTAPAEYASRFADWFESAAVRSRPPLDASSGADLLCFPTELAPVLRHPDVQMLAPQIKRQLLMQHLFSYLTFTDRLEDEVVNRSARRIAIGAMELRVPVPMRLDAYKIYCDEGYHSLFSADLMAQLAARSGFIFDGGEGHPAMTFFHARRAALDRTIRPWFELFFAIVSETLISSSLLRIPRAPDVLPAVRQLVADHAADEWRHHAFFAHVCKIAWAGLPDQVQRTIGPQLPECIFRFLAPDTPALLAFLAKTLGRSRACEVVQASYPASALRIHARSAARSAMRVFEQAGLFERAEVADAFEAAGLINGVR